MIKIPHFPVTLFPVVFLVFSTVASLSANASSTGKIQTGNLTVEVSAPGDTYTLRSSENNRIALTARVSAQVNHEWLSSSAYPHHEVKESSFTDELGDGSQLAVTHSGIAGKPDLICLIRLRSKPAFAEIEVQVHNGTSSPTTVQAIRVFESVDPFVQLDGPQSSNRVLSDSFSEDRPDMEIHDLAGRQDGMHRAVGSQLIYNRQSRQSWFLGALTSERWLTVIRLHVDQKRGERSSATKWNPPGPPNWPCKIRSRIRLRKIRSNSACH